MMFPAKYVKGRRVDTKKSEGLIADFTGEPGPQRPKKKIVQTTRTG